jgi:hypothetical protein
MARYLAVYAGILLLPAVVFLSCGGENENTAGYFPNTNGSTWMYKVTAEIGGGQPLTYYQTYTINGTMVIDGVTCQIQVRTDTFTPAQEIRGFFYDNESSSVKDYGEDVYQNDTLVRSVRYSTPLDNLEYPLAINKNWTMMNLTGINPTAFPFINFNSDDLDNDGIDDTMDSLILANTPLQEDITVPAGTFTACYKIIYTCNLVIHFSQLGDQSVVFPVEVWFQPEVGRVKFHYTVDFPDPVQDVQITAELESYTIAP